MKKCNMELEANAVTWALTKGCEQGQSVNACLRQAIEDAMSVPFQIIGDASPPFAQVDDPDGQWQWAVFQNNAPGVSQLSTMRSLKRKIRAAREIDQSSSFHDNWLTGFDLTKKSGIWPNTSVNAVPADEGYACVSVCHRFVLCSTDNKSAGYCTVTLTLMSFCDGGALDAEIEIGTVFIDPACRGIGLSYLLAEAVAAVTVSMLRELHLRLVSSSAKEVCNLELHVMGQCISSGGERFLEITADQFEQQWYEFVDGASEQVRVEITKILFDEE
ncbi:hypothetical protein [Burkholderia sp. Ac-20365]|jgi:hypothetical protein|uniref:hypothetical protein n=1 Tax=Burkholderia sp. Ac-20365 TaxID=2703897 RepID=UPI00197C53CE|nr:hypothetical protein [Burkholderia sp. Ac-20365]MBN3760782.1 hypothetical protein [Burkholderia sp. Ac-20365]